MNLNDIVEAGLGAIISALLPIVFWRQHKVNQKIKECLTEDQVEQKINEKISRMDSKIDRTQYDIEKVSDKLDKILLNYYVHPSSSSESTSEKNK